MTGPTPPENAALSPILTLNFQDTLQVSVWCLDMLRITQEWKKGRENGTETDGRMDRQTDKRKRMRQTDESERRGERQRNTSERQKLPETETDRESERKREKRDYFWQQVT